MSNKATLLSQLQPSTKITLITCISFLILTAGTLIFLMQFPIEPEQSHQTMQAESPVTEILPTESTASADGAATEPPHTLSTWSASVDGYVKATGGYPVESGREDDETSTNTTDEIEDTTDYIESADNSETAETSTAVPDETTGEASDTSEQQTETIPQVSNTEPPTEAPTEPEPMEPPAVDPVQPEDIPDDVIVD